MFFVITFASFLLTVVSGKLSEIGPHILQFFGTSAFTIFGHPRASFVTNTASTEETLLWLMESPQLISQLPLEMIVSSTLGSQPQ